MGYIYLAIALLITQLKGYCGKKQSLYLHGVHDALGSNTLRMACCAAVSILIVLIGEGASALSMSTAGYLVSVLSGITTTLSVVFWILAVQRSAYVLVDVFGTVGVIVPLVACRILFDERISLMQWIGFALLCGAVTLMCSYSTQAKGRKIDGTDILLLVTYGLSYGTSDLAQKLFVNYCPEGSAAVFNFYTFLFAALFAAILLGVLLILGCRPEAGHVFPLKQIWLYIVLMAVSLFICSYMKTAASAVLPAVQVFPLFQGGILICASLMAAIFFGEKITKRSIAGMSLTFIALLMINML